MGETIIEAHKLSIKVWHRYLLNDVNWKVNRGENWVVFGMNGSGKTTLLSLVAGYRAQTSGELKVFGEAYSNENALEIRKKIGWVSASFYDKLYSRESVLDIILSGVFGTVGIRGNVADEDVILAKKLLKEFHIEDKMNRSFATLSKGERQSVLLARALISKPEILILDEPCTGLDICNREHLFSLIRKLSADRNITIIYVTHYVEEILDIFEHAIFLKHGLIAANGTVEEVFSSEKFSKLIEYPIEIYRDAHGVLKTSANVPSNILDII